MKITENLDSVIEYLSSNPKIETNPYPEYNEKIYQALGMLKTDMKYQKRYKKLEGKPIEKMNRREIATMLTFIVRGERFSVGHIASYVESGDLLKLMLQLKKLNEERLLFRHSDNTRTENSSKTSTNLLLRIAVCTTLIIICSWITIPTAIPFTMQLFGICFALDFLGGRRGTASIALYILLGLIGIPVFAGFGGGIGVILGPLGGFIIGFLALAGIVWLSELIHTTAKVKPLISMLIGLLFCYSLGVIWFMKMNGIVISASTLRPAIGSCVLPFIIPDVAKILAALELSKRLKKLIK